MRLQDEMGWGECCLSALGLIHISYPLSQSVQECGGREDSVVDKTQRHGEIASL